MHASVLGSVLFSLQQQPTAQRIVLVSVDQLYQLCLMVWPYSQKHVWLCVLYALIIKYVLVTLHQLSELCWPVFISVQIFVGLNASVLKLCWLAFSSQKYICLCPVNSSTKKSVGLFALALRILVVCVTQFSELFSSACLDYQNCVVSCYQPADGKIYILQIP